MLVEPDNLAVGSRRETADHIVAELGDVLIGRAPARGGPGEITLFKSLGIAIEDLAAAHHVLGKANAEDAGVSAPLGSRHPPDGSA